MHSNGNKDLSRRTSSCRWRLCSSSPSSQSSLRSRRSTWPAPFVESRHSKPCDPIVEGCHPQATEPQSSAAFGPQTPGGVAGEQASDPAVPARLSQDWPGKCWRWSRAAKSTRSGSHKRSSIHRPCLAKRTILGWPEEPEGRAFNVADGRASDNALSAVSRSAAAEDREVVSPRQPGP